ncbi:hypothetical protein ACNFU2_16560 [Chryseobacterium sp. PTM-20240506]|uniref:hypothetical protein n=1 Tax=unclassified Chryseobacterium TaxID=2593645 RepID=UPI002358F6C7|nr:MULTISPECIES: hypothetical protein [unclassified Chryseobacterium]MDC8106504.1 hypothetical protein [Chryseobacterium sp. B21-037]MDQ1805007.1 hypothetical protein [Chryseobacterium sp. CKR4-1]
MKRIVFLITTLFYEFLFPQNIDLKLSDNLQYINITLKSGNNLEIRKDIEYANNTFYQVKKSGIREKKLTLFLYDEKNNFIESGIANKIGNIRFESIEQSEAYWKEKEILEKARLDLSQININISKSKGVLLEFPFRVYADMESLFKDYPCTLLNCWYEFYSLERGKKYKMQVQLKIKSKIYKSNMVEFVY